MLLAGKNLFTPYRVEPLSDIYSPVLRRPIVVQVFIPPSYYSSRKRYPLLLLNDGQDADAIRLKSTMTRLTKLGQMREIIVAAVHAGDRMQEYGVASKPDYKKRGSKAAAYSTFIVTELLPLLKGLFRIDWNRNSNAIAGFSLGGLSAFDIGWNNPELFKQIGVFSGSLWWRSRAYNDGYSDLLHRIMHVQVNESEFREGLRFWFETGTEDERADRNGNGIIDSIDDTLDLITELTIKGYRPFHDIQYLEIKGGHHNQKTWAKALPYFLKWAFEP